MLKRVRCFIAFVAFFTVASNAAASTCAPFDVRSAPVIVSGNVIDIRTGASGGTNAGASSLFYAGGIKQLAANIATIDVTQIYKGVVPSKIEVTSAMPNGVNLGAFYRPGPIMLALWRSESGALVSNICGAIALKLGDVEKTPIIEPEFFSDVKQNETGNQAVSPAAAMLRYVNEALKRPLAALKVNPGDIDAAKEASRLLRLINDGERDEALWRNVADAGHKAEAIAELGRTLANEQKFSEAVSVLEDAAQRGVDTSAVLSQAKLNAGLKSDLASLEMKDLTTNRLDISGADLRERNLSGLKANELAAHGANLTNADMSGVAMTVAQLTQAVLDGANLDRARIHQVDLSGARLRRASLKSADFAIVAATDADFREIAAEGLRAGGIRMAGAKFDGAHLAGANFDYARGAGSFINADLTGATFRRAKLGGVNFDGAKFDKVDFSDAIYDCETRFPSGFSPEAHPEMTRWVGPCKWEKQDRSGPVDHVILKGCGDECHAWLIADPRRFVLVSTREAKIFYAAAFSHDKNCPWLRSDLFTQVIQNGSVGFDFDYVDRLKQAGFCPHIRPESSPDETAPLFSPTVNMDVWKGDVLRSILMSRAEFQSKAAPAIGRISPADRRAQILNLYLSFNAVDFVDLLADEFVAVLESDSQSQIDVEHIAFSCPLPKSAV
ncbi:uncharacterized protein YjbI with pentapeptide repeats [Rhodoblastus acidophilus]|uniref:pentapeptide repeat-containing protein n=1 Tax=Rhodoblastus acidophilus TaxID=1074 RepID=UPI0022251AC7|nr:pentapeptide repeat-containing protein [Rhodoblastus acidophilus]MCW2286290.1 uncharacterized protein YjbI with pentapeptide repeats [Rhodoblastus acidophilus]MCW2335185.1 uncharacterized protein YjbI with pentapeptide repeats [Rhodoblastus acidophilus]